MEGCTKTHKGVKYAAILKNVRSFNLISSENMVQNHPFVLFKFLQNRVEFDAQRNVHFNDQIENDFAPVGQPKLLGMC